MTVVTVRVDEKTRKELDEVASELGESASEAAKHVWVPVRQVASSARGTTRLQPNGIP